MSSLYFIKFLERVHNSDTVMNIADTSMAIVLHLYAFVAGTYLQLSHKSWTEIIDLVNRKFKRRSNEGVSE